MDIFAAYTHMKVFSIAQPTPVLCARYKILYKYTSTEILSEKIYEMSLSYERGEYKIDDDVYFVLGLRFS